MDDVRLGILVLGLPLGVLTGGWTGLSGYSAWPLVVPLLYVVGQRPLYESLAASMCVDWVNAAAALPFYLRRDDADRGVALRLAAVSAPLVLVGALLAFAVLHRFADLLQYVSGLVAMALGLALIVRALRTAEETDGRAPAAPSPGLRAAANAGVGATAFGMGFVGMGGGFNVAVLLTLLRGYSTRAGVGTGLLFTALALPVALLAYLVHLGFALPFGPLLAFCACTALGSALAAHLAGRLSSRSLGLAVGACVLSAGGAATLQSVVTPP